MRVDDEERRARGRVVMLVDNGVKGDSRVQKIARSAADAGWEVILLGVKSASSVEDTWRIGAAEVRLVEVKPHLAHRPARLRRPLAYPPGPVAAYRARAVRARQSDLAVRRARLRAAGGGRWGELRLLLPRIAAKLAQKWVGFRRAEYARLKRARANPKAPFTALPIWFWTRVLGARSWRRLHPQLWEYVLAFGPVVEGLRPDLIHAHDFRMSGVAARAAVRLRAAGHPVRWVWDAHEYVAGVMPRADNPRWLPAHIAYEKEHAPHADAVVTVSPTLAEMLQRVHGLRERPAVVLNAPERFPKDVDSETPPPDIRALCGIDRQAPLLVYSGGVNPMRGIDTVIDALPRLAGVHLALVTLHPNGTNAASDRLRDRADELGVGDRTHFLPYVPHWQVADFLRPADVGVIPLRHQTNHEIALITKFFEYSHARLPIVVSDVRTMAETVRATGQGEVFPAGDLDAFVDAVRGVLADPARYRAAYDAPGLLEQWTWEAQAEVLEGVYQRLLPDRCPVADNR